MTKVELLAASSVEKNVMGSHSLLLLSHHLVLFLGLEFHFFLHSRASGEALSVI